MLFEPRELETHAGQSLTELVVQLSSQTLPLFLPRAFARFQRLRRPAHRRRARSRYPCASRSRRRGWAHGVVPGVSNGIWMPIVVLPTRTADPVRSNTPSTVSCRTFT